MLDAVTRAVRGEIRVGADWIKFGVSGGFGTPTDDPGQPTYSQDEMDALVATAGDLSVPCTPHAYGDEAVARAVRAGVRSIEHGHLASAETLSLMQQRGVFPVPTQFIVIDALNHLDDDSYWQGKDPAEREKFERYADQLRESTRNVADSDSDSESHSAPDAGMFPREETGVSSARWCTPITATRGRGRNRTRHVATDPVGNRHAQHPHHRQLVTGVELISQQRTFATAPTHPRPVQMPGS